VSIYVDDLLFTGDEEELLGDFKCSMKKEFEMTDLGHMRFLLGIEVIQVLMVCSYSKRGMQLKF